MSVWVVTWRCDRCGGTERTQATTRHSLAPYPRGWCRGTKPHEQPARPIIRGGDYDLCKPCSTAFNDWWGPGSRSK